MNEKPTARRADAVRNRARLLEAGERLMRESRPIGPDAVAKEAGVGVGTFYRHFPTVGEFATELLAADIEQVAGSAGELLTAAPPPDALRRWIELLSQLVTRKDLVASALSSEAALADASPMRLVAALQQILEAGQEAGLMRSDIKAENLMLLVVGAVTTRAKLGEVHDLDAVIDLIVTATRP